MLTLDGATRIVKAAGIDLRTNLRALIGELDYAVVIYRFRMQRKSDTWQRELKANLSGVKSAAKRLARLLRDNDTWHEIVTKTDPLRCPRDYPEKLAMLADKALEAVSKRDASEVRLHLRLDKASQFVWLAGTCLPGVFETHFGVRATGTTADGSHETPYVRFVRASLQELQIQHNGKAYAASTVATALRRARRDQDRADKTSRGTKRKKKK